MRYAVLLLAVSCTATDPASYSGPAPVSDAAVTTDGASDAAPEDPPCGPAPHAKVTMTVFAVSANGEAPLPGVKFTTPLCPERSVVTGADGTFKGRISRDKPFYGRFEAESYVKVLTPELLFAADEADARGTLLPAIFTALIQGYNAQKATLFIEARKDGGKGACATVDGVRFSIAGTSATPTYYSADQIPAPIAGTETTTSGRASFAGLDLGEPIAVTGEKTGCTVTLVKTPQTGKAPREAGYITLMAAYVSGGSDDAGAD